MKKKISDLKRVLQQFSLIAQQLLKENGELKQKCSNQQTNIQQLSNNNSELERDLGVIQGKYDSLLSERDSLREKVELKEQAKKKKEALIQENTDLKSQVDKLRDKVKELEDRLKQKDEEFYTSISGMLESIQQRCADNGAMVSIIKNQISGLSSAQTKDTPPEAIEKTHDDEMQESYMQDKTNDSINNNSPEPTSNNDDPESTELNDKNDTSSSGGFKLGGEF